MKKFSLFFLSILFCITSVFAADNGTISGAESIIWAGIDFSQVKMIGPDFNKPDEIFPGMLEKWNGLFLKEKIITLTKDLKKKIVLDVECTRIVNKDTSASQIFVSPGPEDGINKTHITDAIIAKQVNSYKMVSKSGIGLVFIVDRFVKLEEKGAVYVVYFDVATRKVISSKREVNSAAGFGFRNYWFRVIKKISVGI